jgi:hypothetical protein
MLIKLHLAKPPRVEIAMADTKGVNRQPLDMQASGSPIAHGLIEYVSLLMR